MSALYVDQMYKYDVDSICRFHQIYVGHSNVKKVGEHLYNQHLVNQHLINQLRIKVLNHESRRMCHMWDLVTSSVYVRTCPALALCSPLLRTITQILFIVVFTKVLLGCPRSTNIFSRISRCYLCSSIQT